MTFLGKISRWGGGGVPDFRALCGYAFDLVTGTRMIFFCIIRRNRSLATLALMPRFIYSPHHRAPFPTSLSDTDVSHRRRGVSVERRRRVGVAARGKLVIDVRGKTHRGRFRNRRSCWRDAGNS